MHLDMDPGNPHGSVPARTVEELERAVYEKYPETEGHLPIEERLGSIPDGIKQEIEESAR